MQQKPDKRIINIAVVAIVIIAFASSWLYLHSKQDSSKQSYYNYKYTDLADVKLLNGGRGQSMDFKAPKEFQEVTQQPATHDYTVLVHNKFLPSRQVTMGYEAASVTNVTPAPTQEYLKSLDKAITTTTDKSHSADIKPIEEFTSGRVSPRYKIKFGNFTNFKSSNITGRAWVADFKGADTTSKIAEVPKHITGKVYLMVGKSSYYYFLVASVDENWTPNGQTWQQIENSIKIDQ